MQDFLKSALRQFNTYKALGEKTFVQLPDESLFWQPSAESNSIAIIVQHLCGNMLSRWTDFMTTDGEKEWRHRDAEFETVVHTRQEMMNQWEKGWNCLFAALDSLQAEDLSKIIYIRQEPHTVLEAINRQLAHYPYHVGQIVYIGKLLKDSGWQSLSIPRGKSEEFNQKKREESR